jgi:hypothetical protein
MRFKLELLSNRLLKVADMLVSIGPMLVSPRFDTVRGGIRTQSNRLCGAYAQRQHYRDYGL